MNTDRAGSSPAVHIGASKGQLLSTPPDVLGNLGVWFTAQQVAANLQFDKRVIYRAIETGALKCVRLGGRREVRIRRDWLDAWLDRQESRTSTSTTVYRGARPDCLSPRRRVQQ